MFVRDTCSTDVVLDTNVLSHAENSSSSHQTSAVAVLEWMRECTTLWVLDDNGKSAPDPATSVLYAEYRQTLSPQSLGLMVLNHCFSTGRFDFARRPDYATRKALETLIPRNKQDRAVAGAALGSTDRVLVSNDLGDFTEDVRAALRKTWKLTVILSDQAAS